MRPSLRWYPAEGPPLAVRDVVLTPRSHVLEIRFANGAFVWQRPTSLHIHRAGEATSVPIVDVTRVAQVALVLTAAVFTLLAVTRRKP
jgi:hypothetical protein